MTSRQVTRNSSRGNCNSDGRDAEKLINAGGATAARLLGRDNRFPVETRLGPFNKAPASDVPFDQPFGFKELIGGGNRRPVQSKWASQFPSRRQPLTPTIRPERIANLMFS